MSLGSPRWAACLGALGLAVACLFFGGCRKSVPDAPPPVAAPPPTLEVTAAGKWLYTYADEAGKFVTTDDRDKVPSAARRLVRVIDPAQAAGERPEAVAVYVVDLDEVAKKGKATAKAISREAFETGALSHFGPGESSAFPGSEGAPSADGTPPAPSPNGAVVTLYGTSWCGACRSAREYLRSRRIPFADKDIERDPAAKRELAAKAQKLGVSADRIPVLDVRGRLLIGFDKARLEALLGEAT